MKCWICGNEASTGEHMTKASDLRSLFGQRSQKNPLFLHSKSNINQRVPGINSNILKSKALICAFCNNERTQPYDLAWEKLSTYLRNHQPPIRPKMKINLKSIFPGKVHRSMLFVHLFFLKLFGCHIVENSIPIDITLFSSGIINGEAHPKLYLAFEAITDQRCHKIAGRTSIQTAQINGHVSYAVWLYDVGRLSVHVIYAEPYEQRRGLQGAWHPSSTGGSFKFISHLV